MAYLFSRLNEAIDGAAGGRRASDLLQGGPVQQDRETMGGQQSQGISSQPSAVVGGANPAQPQANASTEAATAVSADARNKVFEKNRAAGNQMTTETTAKLGSGIADAQKNMQAEANKFVEGAAYKSFDTAKADSAVEGNKDAGREVQEFLFQAPKEQGPWNQTWNDGSIEGLRDSTRNLQSQAGLATTLRQGAGADYTRGEANLDAQFLQGSEAFRRSRANLAQSFAGLADSTKAAEATTTAASENAKKAREADRAALTQMLQGRATSMVDADAQTGRAENAARQALNDKAGSVREELLQSFLKRPEFADGGFAGVTNRDMMRKIFDDPSLSRFLTAGGGVGNYVSDTTAGRFNRINELLGKAERIQASGSLEGRGGFDEAGYRAAVDGLLGRLPLNKPKAPQQSQGLPVPIAGSTFNNIDRLIEGVKSAGRAADPTSATSRTNPISGAANTVAKATSIAAGKAPAAAKPAAKAVAKAADKGAKAAQAVARLGRK